MARKPVAPVISSVLSLRNGMMVLGCAFCCSIAAATGTVAVPESLARLERVVLLLLAARRVARARAGDAGGASVSEVAVVKWWLA